MDRIQNMVRRIWKNEKFVKQKGIMNGKEKKLHHIDI